MKKVISLIMVIIMSFTLVTGCFADNAEPVPVNPAVPISSLETQYYNEYDKIVAIRNEVNESDGADFQAYMSDEDLEYIMSDAIEAELLHRAGLPTEVLKENYGYSDEAVAILRDYDGSRIEAHNIHWNGVPTSAFLHRILWDLAFPSPGSILNTE